MLKGWIIQTGKHADGFGLTCTDFKIHVSGDPSIYIVSFEHMSSYMSYKSKNDILYISTEVRHIQRKIDRQ